MQGTQHAQALRARHGRQVARLAGGLGWFAAVELLHVEGGLRTRSELVSVEALEARWLKLQEELEALT